MRRLLSCLAMLTMFSGPLHAQEVAVESSVYVERQSHDLRIVEQTDQLRRGDRVVTILRWDAPADGPFIMTSEVPPTLSLESASSNKLIVSSDGGKSWRRFTGMRPERVTHLRWSVREGAGRLTYSAIVR